jgi:hypothetical protein
MPKTTLSDKLAPLANHANTIPLLLIVGAVLLASSGYYWYDRVYRSPHRIFWDMVDHTLSTPSVTRIAEVPGNGDLSQHSQLQMNGEYRVQTITEMSRQNSSSKTESVVTPQLGFVRYLNLEQKLPAGSPDKPIDFSSIENIWSKLPANEADGHKQLIIESMFGPVMFGNLRYGDRREIIQTLRDKRAYHIDFGAARRVEEDGRATVIYDVILKPKGYIESVATYFTRVGLDNDLFGDTSRYTGDEEVKLEMAVDQASRQLRRVKYQDQSGREETYKNYGIMSGIQLPKADITTEELQQKIQELQPPPTS